MTRRNLASSIIAHPSPASFSHAMAQHALSVLESMGYEVRNHDLYQEQFDPVRRVSEMEESPSEDGALERHCAEVKEADLILIFHPNWWGQPPAILKGWVDRVLRLGTAYTYRDGAGPESEPLGLLRARSALIFNTSNTPADREATVFGNPLELLWRQVIFSLCGVGHVEQCIVGPMSGSTDEQRKDWLARVEAIVHLAARTQT